MESSSSSSIHTSSSYDSSSSSIDTSSSFSSSSSESDNADIADLMSKNPSVQNMVNNLRELATSSAHTLQDFSSTLCSSLQSTGISKKMIKKLVKLILAQVTCDKLEPVLPFCISRELDLVSLPVDLINEPFAAVDNGIRPDIFTTRPFARVRVGHRGKVIGTCDKTSIGYELQAHLMLNHHKFDKLDSCISVFDVYDAYGLAVAYSFLHHIYHHRISLNYPRLLSIYLATSLAVVQPQYAVTLFNNLKLQSELLSLTLSSILLTELVLLESKQPRLCQDEIEPHQTVLPCEILARIFNSKRISKSISDQVTHLRQKREFRVGELAVRCEQEAVRMLNCNPEQLCLKLSNYFLCIQDDNVVVSRSCNVEDQDECSCVILYSFVDQARLRRVPRLQMLEGMLDKVDRDNEMEVFSWILFSCVSSRMTPCIQFERHQALEMFDTLTDQLVAMVRSTTA